MVKALRESTGAGVMDAKRALEEADGDAKRAVEILREKGVQAAAKRSDRATNQGVLEAYVHQNRIGVLVEINCETDFVANTDDFRGLAKSVALQIAAMNPQVVAPEDREGKDLVGSDAEVCLVSMPFIKEPSRTIGDLIRDAVAKTGENIRVSRFSRFELGR
jgi:elongation factor Ts